MPGTRITLAERAKIVELHKQGFSNCKIEKLTGKSQKSILMTMKMYVRGMIDLQSARDYQYKAKKSRFEKVESSAPTPLSVQVEANRPEVAAIDKLIAKAKLKVQECEEANRQAKGNASALNQAESYYRSLNKIRENLIKNHERKTKNLLLADE